MYVTDPGMSRTTAEQCRAAAAALAAANSHDPTMLGSDARILAQNAALRVFISAPARCEREGISDIAGPAARLVARLALPQKQLEALGSDPGPELDVWIGARQRWQDMGASRPSRHATLFHDQAEKHTRLFRPVRRDDTRAIFSQIVAVDTDWNPHVTPLVAKIEMRTGLQPSAPACAAKIDVARIQCGAHLTPVVDLTALPTSRFLFRVADHHVGCNQCHATDANTGANLTVLDRTAGDRERRSKTHAALLELRTHIERLRGLAR